MVDLTRFRKANIFFFGNEQEKREFYLECICPYFSVHKRDAYFATREWNGGPNVEVVYRGPQIDKKELRSVVVQYCKSKNLTWTDEEIEENLSNYRKNQSNLLLMEKKEKIEIYAGNNLKIKDNQLEMSYYKKIYNSSDQVQLHFESRFLLQPLIEEALKNIESKKEMHLLVMKLFQITMQLFEYGEKYASLMYFSNIAGIFGIARQYGKENAFRSYFEKEYIKYDMKQLESINISGDLVERFRDAWQLIYKRCSALVEENKLSEEGFYQLADQEKQMQLNIQDIESEFHQTFRKDKHLHDIVSGKIHLTFRSIANILYNIMPALNITFLEKNFCCYAIVHYIMEKYDTNWKQIMAERVIEDEISLC